MAWRHLGSNEAPRRSLSLSVTPSLGRFLPRRRMLIWCRSTAFSMIRSRRERLAPAANVRLHTALACFLLAIVVVVALVQADVLGPPWPTRSVDECRIECGADHPLVVDVRAGQRDREGNPAPVGQNVALAAEFSAIGGIGTREVPPFGAFTEALSSDAHSRSRPHFSW